MAVLKTRLILRNDSSANWTAAEAQNLLLMKGEAAVEWYEGTGDLDGDQVKDTGETAAKPKIKIGDGFSKWSELPYLQANMISTTVSTSGTGNTVVGASVSYNETTGIYSLTLTKANRVVDIAVSDDNVVDLSLTKPTGDSWSTAHSIAASHAAQGPSKTANTTSTANSGNATPSADKVINIPKITVNKYGHTTAVTNETVTIKAHDIAVTQSGTGNAVVSVTKDTANHSITVTKGDVVGSIEVADDDIVNLEVDNTTNPQKPKITGTHALKGPNTTASTTKGPTKDVTISGSGATGSIKIPKVTVDKYGHTTGLTEQTLSITMPTLPTLSVVDNETGNVLTDLEVSNHAITLKRGLEVYSKTEVDNKIAAATNAAVVMKGTLGTNGTVTALPAASYDTLGDAYKVITAAKYVNNENAKVGDLYICYESAKDTYGWILIPAGDSDTDTWRAIKVNGTQKLATGTSTGAVDFIDGNGIDITFESGGKIKFTANISEIIDSKAYEYKAGTGLVKVDNDDGSHTFNHSNSITAGTAAGDSGAKGLGATVNIPSITYDSEGHITSTTTTQITLPTAANVTAQVKGYGQVQAGNSTAVTAVTGNTTTAQSKSHNEKLSLKGGNKWINVAATNSGTAGSDVITFGHALTSAAKGPHGAATTMTWDAPSFDMPSLTFDEAGHLATVASVTITAPSSEVTKDLKGLAPKIAKANSFLMSKDGEASVWDNLVVMDGGSAGTTTWGTISN